MARSIKNPKKAKRKNKVQLQKLTLYLLLFFLTLFFSLKLFCNWFLKKNSKSGASSSSGPVIQPRVWQPGVDELEEGEELQCDPSAYNSLHAFHLGWPCLRYMFHFLCFGC